MQRRLDGILVLFGVGVPVPSSAGVGTFAGTGDFLGALVWCMSVAVGLGPVWVFVVVFFAAALSRGRRDFYLFAKAFKQLVFKLLGFGREFGVDEITKFWRGDGEVFHSGSSALGRRGVEAASRKG